MLYLALAVLALLVGSFLNVVIYRLPMMMEDECKKDCATLLNQPPPACSNLNLCYPRSFCPACKKPIGIFSNIPLLSYCIQKGKCSHCKASISIQYPLVESLSLVLSLFAVWQFGWDLKLLFSLGFIWTLLPLFFIDLRKQLLPDVLTLGLLWLGLLANTQNLFAALPDAVFGAIIGYLVLWILVRLFYLFTGKIGMGHGDYKLFAALGAWFGWVMIPLMLLCASIMGVVGGLIYLKLTHQSKDTPIPFGPFLCLTALLTMFYGNPILGWYLA